MSSFRWFRKSSATKTESFQGQHRFEHWYLDNQMYFITARCRDRYPAFAGENAKAVFWDRFEHYTDKYGFKPCITSLLDNHYHTIGYLAIGENLGKLMQRLHGSVAKLTNDLLTVRRVPFWREKGHRDYFDGCLRNEKQFRLAYRYVLTQSVRHGIVSDHRLYPHTHVIVDLEPALKQALDRRAFLEHVPYKRYQ